MPEPEPAAPLADTATANASRVDRPRHRDRAATLADDVVPAGAKRPQSVLVVIATRGGEFLLLRRRRPMDFWQSVTGSLACGESPRLCAVREVREETGIEAGGGLRDLHRSVLFPIIPAWRQRYPANVCFNREYWFALVLPARRLIRLSPAEHLEHCWLTADRAARLATSWTNREAIERLWAGLLMGQIA